MPNLATHVKWQYQFPRPPIASILEAKPLCLEEAVWTVIQWPQEGWAYFHRWRSLCLHLGWLRQNLEVYHTLIFYSKSSPFGLGGRGQLGCYILERPTSNFPFIGQEKPLKRLLVFATSFFIILFLFLNIHILKLTFIRIQGSWSLPTLTTFEQIWQPKCHHLIHLFSLPLLKIKTIMLLDFKRAPKIKILVISILI